MAYINLIELENADGILKAEYKKGIQRAGKIYNILKIMSRSPEAVSYTHLPLPTTPYV